MRFLIYLSLLLITGCVSPEKFKTFSYANLSKDHKKIAILPVVFEGKMITELPENEKNLLLKRENDFIQSMIYQEILLRTGLNKKDIKIKVESLQATNDKLIKKGINIYNLGAVPFEDITNALDADVVFQTHITTEIFLHSTKNDLSKELLDMAEFYFDKNLVIHRIGQTKVVPVFIKTEITDVKHKEPVWAFSKRKDLRLKEKNTDLVRNIAKALAKRFPYR